MLIFTVAVPLYKKNSKTSSVILSSLSDLTLEIFGPSFLWKPLHSKQIITHRFKLIQLGSAFEQSEHTLFYMI